MKYFAPLLLFLGFAMALKSQSCLGNYTFATAATFDPNWVNGCSTGSSCSGGTSFTNMASCEPTTALDPCAPAPTGCGTDPTGSDLWYNFYPVGTTATINVIQNTSFIATIQAYSEGSDCATLTQIGCAIAGGPSSGVQLNLTGLTPGERYYYRVFGTATPSAQRTGIFCFCGSTGLGGTPLAIRMYLQGEAENPAAVLNWDVEGDASLDHFSIERSKNAVSFAPIANVDAAVTSSLTGYEYRDEHIPSGVYYYRIKAFNSNGNSVISNIVEVTVKNAVTFEITGNPCKDYLNIDAQEDFAGEILNVNGEDLMAVDIEVGINRVNVEQLRPGIYFLRNVTSGIVGRFMVLN